MVPGKPAHGYGKRQIGPDQGEGVLVEVQILVNRRYIEGFDRIGGSIWQGAGRVAGENPCVEHAIDPAIGHGKAIDGWRVGGPDGIP